MSNATQFGKVKVQQATGHKVTNVTIAIGDINIEQSHILQNGLKKLIIMCRGNGEIKYTFISGQSGSIYKTIPRFTEKELAPLSFNSKTLYFQSDKVSVIEIEELY